MKLISLINPTHKRWVALFFLLCWVVPFLALTSFSIFVTTPVTNQPPTAKKYGQAIPEVGDDHKVKSAVTEENKISKTPPAEPPVPPVQQTNTVPTTPQTPTTGGGQSDPIDLNLLARVIHAEARGEPLEGQVAVGAVLINRVRSAKFPNDLWSVVFKKGEFCTVRDGQVWMEPNSTAYRAARLAKAGWDPTNGALYFYNPSKTTSAWIWSRTVTTRIGSHIFAV